MTARSQSPEEAAAYAKHHAAVQAQTLYWVYSIVDRIIDEMLEKAAPAVSVHPVVVEQWARQLRWIVTTLDDENNETLDAVKVAGWLK